MTLQTSTDSIYFPNVPRDNAIKISWSESPAQLQESRGPSTVVVFKMKCSSPQLYFVRPRYGALLLVDDKGTVAAASTSPPSLRAHTETHVIVGLREYYANVSNGRAQDTATTRVTTANRGTERFAAEYAILSGDASIYQQLADARDDYARTTEAVKAIWSRISSGDIKVKEGFEKGRPPAVNLRVYADNVFMRGDEGNSTGGKPIVVPSSARLIPLSLHDRPSAHGNNDQHSTPVSAITNTTNSHALMANNGGGVNEVQALRREIENLREDVRVSPMTAASYTHSDTPQQVSSRNDRDAARSPTATRTAAAEADAGPRRSGASPSPSSENTLMQAGPFSPVSSGSRKGLRMYVVLGIMFAIYILAVMMRRGGEVAASVAAPGSINSSGGARNAAKHMKLPSTAKVVQMDDL